MSDSVAADNDLLYKGAWFGLLRELLAVVPAPPTQTMVLGHAKFVVAKKLERQKKKGVRNVEDAIRNFEMIAPELSAVEPSSEELAFAAELEREAALAGLALDEGESQLCAIVVSRDLRNFVTGDKRAIAALETLLVAHGRVSAIGGKVLCLEQLFRRLLACLDPARVKRAVCTNAHVDRALSNCFSCASPEAGLDHWELGLDSYIEATRSAAPTVLSRTIP